MSLGIHTHTPHTQISFANSKEVRNPDPNPSQLPTLLFLLSFESINHDTAHKASNHTHTPNRFSFLLILFLILFSLFEGVHPSPYIKRDHRSVQEDYSRIQPRARLYWCIGRCPSCWCCCRCCINFAFSISVCEDPRSNRPCPKVFY